MRDPFAWRLDFDPEGRVIVIPVEFDPRVMPAAELPYPLNRAFEDPGMDPEYNRAATAGLAR